jgi:hypothetical protein
MQPRAQTRTAVFLICAIALAASIVLLLLPPVRQDPAYHAFADQRTLWGIPNFANVASNFLFLLVALWGLRALRAPSAFLEPWERIAYLILLIGVGLVAFGSAYYHAHPDNQTLFWDRLPMTVAFMSLLATTVGERISPAAGKLLLVPLLALGVASVLYWRALGDLRLYGFVQFYPVLVLPLLIAIRPPRYSGTGGLFATMGFYALAKILEAFDRQIASVISTGGHPWKHAAGAIAMLCYVNMVARRKPLTKT